jgi:hypothetical protein
MLLLISAIFAVLPLAGIAFMIYANPELTVDNLFTSLILLTISGLFGLNVLMELRDRGLPLPLLGKKTQPALAAAMGASVGGSRATAPMTMSNGAVREGGVVEHVGYYESGVGRSNRSIVTLRTLGSPARLLVFTGDVRDQFPLGRRVEVVYHQGEEGADLLERKLG